MKKPVTIDAQVEHLRELLGPVPVHVVGHSVGGVIAALYAHRYPDDVLGMINVEGNATRSVRRICLGVGSRRGSCVKGAEPEPWGPGR